MFYIPWYTHCHFEKQGSRHVKLESSVLVFALFLFLWTLILAHSQQMMVEFFFADKKHVELTP